MNPPKFEDQFPEAAEALKEIYASDFMPFFDANGERNHFPLWFTTKKFETQEGLAFAIIKAYMQRKFHGIGRNDLCPCASGKKYKHCCLNIK